MTGWQFFNPVRLHFGDGEIDRIGEIVRGRSYALLTHPDAALLPWRDRVFASAGEPLIVLDAITPNPTLPLLGGLCAQLLGAGARPDILVALGGGSVMDAAKFLAAGRGDYRAVMAYLESATPLTRAPLPVIAIPTTAGTGSDLTRWATIWDPEKARKLSLNHELLYAEAAIVDPDIMAGLPWNVALASGLDALSHALESIWNINANPITRSFAVAAARNAIAGLKQLHDHPEDGEARRTMALGATQAGYAFSNTQTALAHNLSYPVTLAHRVPHGIACSFCLPEVMASAIGADDDCDAALREIFGDIATAPMRLRGFLDRLGVPGTPGALGIEQPEWDAIVDAAFDGPRGRNFIGPRDRFPGQAIAA
ncbi:MAG: iron-containing alcohol dehydrogenase PsrA [Pseudomonadota bacterium]|jgi:alcohol dehydrogenase|uniref:Alcohol dehydrogenase n=1 Tax=hydrothermal vent metagenome TaxID=652676 RepID=A0A170PNM3_9ZZZZ